MNKDNVSKLLGALRSGEYKKGRGTLRMGEEFCAMGVACDLFRKERPEYRWEPEHSGTFAFMGPGASNRMFCPTQVQDWLDISADDIDSIVNLNDSNGTFEPACKYIERMLDAE